MATDVGVRKSTRQRKPPARHADDVPSTSASLEDSTPPPEDITYTLDKLINEARRTTLPSWHPVIESAKKQIAWVQRETNSPKSKVIREVRVKQLGDLLVPSVEYPTSGEQPMAPKTIKKLLGKDELNVTSWDDVVKLTDHVHVTAPEGNADEEYQPEREAEAEDNGEEDEGEDEGEDDEEGGDDDTKDPSVSEVTGKKKRKRPKKKKKWDDGEFPCEYCGEVFTRIHWMYRHVSMFHPDVAPTEKYAIQSLFQPIYPTYIPTDEERKRFLKKLKEARAGAGEKKKKRDGRRGDDRKDKAKTGAAKNAKLRMSIKKKALSSPPASGRLYCEECDRTFSGVKWLNSHLEKVHGGIVPPPKPSTNGVGTRGGPRKTGTTSALEALGGAIGAAPVTFRRLLAQLEWTIEAFRRKRSMKDAVQSTSLHIAELGLPDVSGAWCLRVIPYAEPGWTSVHLVLKEPQEEGTCVHLMHFAIDILNRENVARRVFNFEKPANEECLPPSNYGVGERDWGVKKTLYHGDLFSKDGSCLVDGALRMRAEIDFVVERKEKITTKRLDSEVFPDDGSSRKRGRKSKANADS